ncbi:MAG: FAD-dependent oxidoreductase [bacterium]|nr:effector protein [Deltaproteobacteria bacterium]MCP4905364.1 FAD-dependent oxidoreductase [bacterium]
MFSHLLSPIRIGNLELRNRIAMAPMGVELGDENGAVTEGVIAYYEARARGGAGLLITENVSAAYPWGANSLHELAFSDDRYLPGLRELTDRVHGHGAKIAAQLSHHGKVARLDVWQGREMLMPSVDGFKGENSMGLDLTSEEIEIMSHSMEHLGNAKVREATQGDIERLIEAFADAGERARRAGFDAVELHAAHGYIFSEFLSPAVNIRTDDYGGSRENRARLLCEVLRAVKLRAGTDFPVWCRLDAMEFRTPGGITLEDAQLTAELACEAGADAIHVTAYADGSSAPGFLEAPLVHKEAGFVEFAASIKRHVDVPVIAVGRIEPEVADRLIKEGLVDVVSMARKLLADPELPRKLEEDRAEDIRPCVYCYTCVAQAFFDRPVRCAVNPTTAREHQLGALERTQAAEPKHVLVIGGGPAGMEAARIAALRGHRVSLCEKSGRLGGTLRFAALAYPPNERLLEWLEGQVAKLEIEVRTNYEISAERVEDIAPDVAIVATGARREKPTIPGADQAHVFDGDTLRDLLTGEPGATSKLSRFGRIAVGTGRRLGITNDPTRLREWSKRYMPLGRRIVVIGGGLVGCELAEFLTDRGREVCVLEEGSVMGVGFAHPRRWRILYELREQGARLETDVRVCEIGPHSVRFERNAAEGAHAAEEIAADSVLFATGLVPNRSLAELLQSKGVPVIEIGDGMGVGYIEGAIHSAFDAAAHL